MNRVRKLDGSYKVFLEELVRLRIAAGISQQELAARLGVGQDLISRGEAGSRRIDVVELQRWTFACGSSLTEFATTLESHSESNSEKAVD
jgi:transcriptional regulator with XRE-family HTH domain